MFTSATEFDRSGQGVNQKVYDLEREGMHEADRTCHNETKPIIIDHYGIDGEKVEVVHNAVVKNESELPGINAALVRTVLFFGANHHAEGPDFIDAAQKVYQKLNDVHFVMAGSVEIATLG